MSAPRAGRSADVADVAIVGGGPAGLATAIEAALAGLSAVVVERGRPPLDKACGEGLMPDAAARLASLGVAVAGRPFRGIRYLDGETVAEGSFPGPPGLGVRRTALHAALVRRAEELEVALRWGVAASGLEPAGVRTSDGLVAARFVVGADGLNSRLRRWAGLEAAGFEKSRGGERARRFGVRRHYAMAPWSDFVEVSWGRAAEAYVTPVAADEVGIAILWSGEAKGFDDLLPCFPALAERLAGAERASRDRGAGPFRQRARGVAAGRVALVGDAAGYLDAITGEGLAIAFHQAQAVVAAMAGAGAGGDLAAYTAAHRRIGRLPNAITGLVLALERRPALRRRAIRALAAEPAIFSRLLGIHGRMLPARRLGLPGAARLAWRLVADG